jgi:hypothetical protein
MAFTKQDVTKYVIDIPHLPEYPLKQDFQRKFNEMAVHTRGKKPKDLLLKRRPNEPKDVFEYRECNYEPVTYGSLNKAFDNLNRILNAVNYRLYYNNDKMVEYLDTKKFMRHNFNMFFSKVILKRMIEDPNGLLFWLPAGPGLKDSNIPVTPIPTLVFSFDLVDWGDEYVVFLSAEKTKLKNPDSKAITYGKVYYIVTTDSFYKYKELTAGKYELELVYVHNLGEIPCMQLGGDLNADGLYESFFYPFVPFANESIRQFSDWQALSITCAHPIREEFYMQCEVQEKRTKRTKKKADDEDNETYSRKVELKPIPRSPYAVIQREIPNTDQAVGDQNVLAADIPSVRFIHPDVEFVKNAWESFNNLRLLAEDALHLNLGDIALSGKAKEIDLLSHEDMLAKIGCNLIDLKQTSARFIQAYMENKPYAESLIKVTKPASFRVKTEQELLEQLNTLRTNKAPSFLVAAVARELAALRFSGDEVNQKIFEVIVTYDPVYIYSVEEKQSMVLSNQLKPETASKSNMFFTLLLNIKEQDGEAKFMDTKNTDLNIRVDELVKPFLIAQPIITDNNGNG